MNPQSPAPTGAVLAPARPLVPQPRTRANRGVVPVRTPEHAHLTLEGLRDYRAALRAEENKVSYWRRILQARLDVVRAGHTGGGTVTLGAEQLRPVLTDDRGGRPRSALLEVVPVDDVPPLPDLAELWERRVAPGDEARQAELEEDLDAAEKQLSSFRAELHQRLGSATTELIARYREQPSLCLSVLPTDPLLRPSAE